MDLDCEIEPRWGVLVGRGPQADGYGNDWAFLTFSLGLAYEDLRLTPD